MLYIVDGQSMQHMGFHDKELVEAVYAPCEEKSVIAFSYKGVDYIKELVTVRDDGAIWVEGRDDVWRDASGSLRKSKDSRTYGYIVADDYDILGCIYEKPLHH